jgi:hemerythrin
MFDWNDSYSVHVASVDAQHKNLFRMAAELHQAMLAGKAKGILAQLLDQLVKYTVVHFAHEERLMQEASYPQLAAHKAQHVDLTRKVLQFQKDFVEGRATMSIDLLNFLKDWLRHHIMESDQKYTPYLQAKPAA